MMDFSLKLHSIAERKRSYLRLFKALMAATTVFAATAVAQPAAAAVDFDIPQQAVSSAMISFSEQANVQIIVDASLVEGLQTEGCQRLICSRAQRLKPYSIKPI